VVTIILSWYTRVLVWCRSARTLLHKIANEVLVRVTVQTSSATRDLMLIQQNMFYSNANPNPAMEQCTCTSARDPTYAVVPPVECGLRNSGSRNWQNRVRVRIRFGIQVLSPSHLHCNPLYDPLSVFYGNRAIRWQTNLRSFKSRTGQLTKTFDSKFIVINAVNVICGRWLIYVYIQ